MKKTQPPMAHLTLTELVKLSSNTATHHLQIWALVLPRYCFTAVFETAYQPHQITLNLMPLGLKLLRGVRKPWFVATRISSHVATGQLILYQPLTLAPLFLSMMATVATVGTGSASLLTHTPDTAPYACTAQAALSPETVGF